MTIAHAEGLAAKLRRGRILLGGHRGNADEFPENTMASFRSAIDLGVDVIECDVHLTADHQLAVIHDHLLDRTTNGHGEVSKMTFDEIRKVDAGGSQVPAFEEVLAFARGKIGVYIDSKQISAKEVRHIRLALNASQALFATYLNVSPNAVRSWEQGIRRPQQAALKLLTIAKKNPKALLVA